MEEYVPKTSMPPIFALQGKVNKINEAGVNYYKNLIKELKDKNIEPMVTLYHWDLPQPLQDAGGWTSSFIINDFADYARLCFELFGDDVKFWATFNEPKQTCHAGYGDGTFAPKIHSPGVGEYLCAHNVIKSHAAAWHIYNNEFRPTQNGKISIVLDTSWFEPATNSVEDEIATANTLSFEYGWWADPIFHGDYPEIMKSRIAYRSNLEGFPRSRLPEFTTEEKSIINGTYDYLALNMYTTFIVKASPEPGISTPNFYNDRGTYAYQPDEWEGSASSWLKVTPWGLRKLLKWLKDNYNSPAIIITENGISDTGTLEDNARVNYLKTYLSNMKDAMEIDEVNVFGYTAWSLMDNFEWLQGYTQKFGLYSVDFTSPNRTRTPKASAEYFKKIISTRCLVDTCEN